MKKLILSLIFATTFTIAMQAQVTIGSDKTPNKAALLDIKDQDADANNITAKTGGLVLPRVSLVSLTTLQPFIASATADEMKFHTGLMVYNLNATSPFAQGIYTWSGTKWILASGLAENGLTETNGVIRLGGDLNRETTIDLKTFDLNLKSLQSLTTSAKGLAVDATTGKIGLNPGIPPKIAFLQSSDQTYISTLTSANNSDDNANSSITYTIPWTVPITGDDSDPDPNNHTPAEDGDIITNNLVVFVPSENAFRILEDAAVELSGYIGYIAKSGTDTDSESGYRNPDNNAGANEVTIVNASIQTRKKGETKWTDCTSVRGTYLTYMTPYRQTLSIPPAMFDAQKGDMFRIVVIPRPKSAANVSLGQPHDNPRIVRPFGTKYSKSLKIIVQ